MNTLRRDDYEGTIRGNDSVTIQYYLKVRISDRLYGYHAESDKSLAKKNISHDRISYRMIFRGTRK